MREGADWPRAEFLILTKLVCSTEPGRGKVKQGAMADGRCLVISISSKAGKKMTFITKGYSVLVIWVSQSLHLFQL